MDEYSNANDDINVEEIMNSIRDEVRKKRSSSTDTSSRADGFLPLHIEEEIRRLESYQNIDNNEYSITSHRKLVGPILVKGRKLVNSEVRRYIDPAIWRQKEFNSSTVRVMTLLLKNIDTNVDLFKSEIHDVIDKRFEDIDKQLDKNESIKQDLYSYIDRRIESLKEELTLSVRKAEERQYDRLAIIHTKINSLENTPIAQSRSLDIPTQEFHKPKSTVSPYIAFEDSFRGSEDEIKERQRFYLKYFPKEGALDIGCGRGEFLELLKENGYKAIGIDIDDNLVQYCIKKGLDVRKSDIIEYLSDIEDNSIEGIFMAQVVEHLDPSELPLIMQLIYKKMAPESSLVIETVNIQNIGALVNFYVDPTHIRPVHPLYLEYLLKSNSYRDIHTVYRNYSEQSESIDLNRMKEISPDYAIICKK